MDRIVIPHRGEYLKLNVPLLGKVNVAGLLVAVIITC